MSPEEFLSLVVPWTEEGFATIHWKAPKPKHGQDTPFYSKSFRTAAAAAEQVALLQGKGFDIWFALARQRVGNGVRKRSTSTFIGCLFADGDIEFGNDKAFSSLEDAVASFLLFCDKIKIPRPSLIVMSGNGIHVYWLSDRHLDVETWQVFADGLRNAMEHTGLRVKDKGLTTDVARVLRPPGTHNYKHGLQKPVYLMEKYSTFERHDFSVVFAPLKQFAPVRKAAKTKINTQPMSPAFAHLGRKNLGEGIKDNPPLAFEPIRAGCAWLRTAYETGGKDFGQAHWNLTTLCATWMENGHELAHRFADRYPEYNYGQTEELWDRKNRERSNPNLGWPSCRAISYQGDEFCKSCPRFKLDKSPLHLATERDADGPEENQDQRKNEAEIQKEIAEIGGSRPEDLRLPQGFAVDEEGRICFYIASQSESKKTPTAARLLHIFKTQIKNPVLQHQDGHFGLGFTASTDKGNWHDVFIASRDLTGKELHRTLAGRFVLRNHEEGVEKLLNQFMSSWIDKLRLEDGAIYDSGTMGWRYEDGERIGFVHGNTLYHVDGSKKLLIITANDTFRSHYQPTGEKTVWLEACKLLTNRKRPQLDILIAASFAAPLTAFGGASLYGVTLSIWGDPGTSKSTAQQVAASVFGHPKQTRESLNSTPKSVQRRLGLTRNFAAYWDDVQSEQHQENLFTTMFVAAGGLEGGRLNQDASMKERLDWQTLLVACSNASFIEYLTRKQKSTTAGMRRVFEIQFMKDPNEPGMIDSVDASLIFARLEHNYGVMGTEYAKVLAACHNEIAVLVRANTKKFRNAVNGNGDESYWWGLCGVLLTGAQLANKLGAELDVTAMNSFLQKAFLYNRMIRKTEGTEAGSIENTEMALVAFVNKYSGEGNILYTKLHYVGKGCEVGQLQQPGLNKQVMIQVARDECLVIISKREFKNFLHKNEIQSRQVIDGLSTQFGAREVKLTLGAGTAYALAQEACFVIPVPLDKEDHPLRETLFQRGAPVPILRDVNENEG